MLIFIPTRGRVGHQYTAKFIPPEWKSQVALVAPSEEAVALKKETGLGVIKYDKIGLSPKRQFILEYAHKNGINKILQLDDDLKFYVKGKKRDKKSQTPFSLYEADELDMDDLFCRVANALTDYAHVGIDTREGCQNHSDGAECIRITRALGYRVDLLMDLKLRFDHVDCMQDFDMGLQLLKLGYPSYVLPKYVQNQARASGATGGCSIYRTSARKAAAAKLLARRHAPFVKLVEKKGWRGLGETMLDVQIQWKKAFQAGCDEHGNQHPLL